jgi:predicted nuclease with TOPRIM domain
MNESKIFQLDFFKTEEESEIDALRERIEAVKVSNDKVRKAMFGRHGDLNKRLNDLEERFQILEKNICKGDNYG